MSACHQLSAGNAWQDVPATGRGATTDEAVPADRTPAATTRVATTRTARVRTRGPDRNPRLSGPSLNDDLAWNAGRERPPTGVIVNNLIIANLFLFLTILCMALSAQLGMPLMFIYSAIAIALAGAMRYEELHKDGATR